MSGNMERRPKEKSDTAIIHMFNMKPIFYGTKTEILIQEKIMLIRYFVEHQQLPPGNKRFH